MISTIQKVLSATYRLCGYLASLFTVLVLVAVVVNILDRLLGGYTAGTNEFASYCVGAAGALGLAYAFGEKQHIRMSLLVDLVKGRARKIIEVACLVIAVGFSFFMSFYLIKMVFVSQALGDRSTGTDGVLLWIPQAPMAFGFFVFSLSLAQALFLEIFPAFRGNEQLSGASSE